MLHFRFHFNVVWTFSSQTTTKLTTDSRFLPSWRLVASQSQVLNDKSIPGGSKVSSFEITKEKVFATFLAFQNLIFSAQQIWKLLQNWIYCRWLEKEQKFMQSWNEPGEDDCIDSSWASSSYNLRHHNNKRKYAFDAQHTRQSTSNRLAKCCKKPQKFRNFTFIGKRFVVEKITKLIWRGMKVMIDDDGDDDAIT